VQPIPPVIASRIASARAAATGRNAGVNSATCGATNITPRHHGYRVPRAAAFGTRTAAVRAKAIYALDLQRHTGFSPGVACLPFAGLLSIWLARQKYPTTAIKRARSCVGATGALKS
jgi:secreted trypsin-like serine protease